MAIMGNIPNKYNHLKSALKSKGFQIKQAELAAYFN